MTEGKRSSGADNRYAKGRRAVRSGETKPFWYGQLRDSPYPEGAFGENSRRRVIERLYGEKGRGRNRAVYAAGALSAAGLLLAAAVAWLPAEPSSPGKGIWPADKEIGNERITRNLYAENNVKLVEAFPGGDYAAGASAGCWWNLYTPIERLKDSLIRIEGVHRETGTKLEELAETKVSEVGQAYRTTTGPGSADTEITRIATRFALPLPGEWDFIVYLDGERYADVVFDVADGPWEVSPTFRSGAYEMRGIAQRLGFIDVIGFTAGKANKYMWHFWGNPEELGGRLEIKAVRQGTQQLTDVFDVERLGSALNGADAAFPSMMMLPKRGKWRLMAFIGGRLYGSIVVEAK
ncbi:DUF4871 domain-containing protein [Paenibacillus ginsengarvi]|uniref:DUF4871 domain-containing protein n=1 Tax=Paenibacillus ginsengarvi TaxID=400777 RepID=A0A3B0CCH4_9BACL|nr:DUF4871 domain-containing protein [Paenibacillus ginsengarvi]RKN82228.1 DUF4871 domain-containing protein [Paenibacillus ginsengarvi]